MEKEGPGAGRARGKAFLAERMRATKKHSLSKPLVLSRRVDGARMRNDVSE